jgi:TadE-like protein
MSRINRRARSSGQALAEFALIAPLFFLMLLFLIESGRFILYYQTLNDATRHGARYAIIHGSNAQDGCPSGPPAPGTASCDVDGDNVRTAVRQSALGLLDLGTLTITDPTYSGPNGSSNARGSTVRVEAAFEYPPILPVFPTVTVTAESSLVVNN